MRKRTHSFDVRGTPKERALHTFVRRLNGTRKRADKYRTYAGTHARTARAFAARNVRDPLAAKFARLAGDALVTVSLCEESERAQLRRIARIQNALVHEASR